MSPNAWLDARVSEFKSKSKSLLSDKSDHSSTAIYRLRRKVNRALIARRSSSLQLYTSPSGFDCGDKAL
ncbi:hypothetical protein HBH98_200870 [Parastagonospora nodorum]|uniref:Uncharacterized protein n=1 Tax=Phaeosphaeria nodorum (strain SN15 / ATCC MYA-4574 / FGSC 10173) TaxID=321614 RepID=A0A7U2F627_PHANO|nr:hypothetical protein HBH54_194910 [Parastagonospora nodorum]QRC99399.1 hypothetical protein JI435_413390 [Parastagonospora nodorum SN15]KAH3940170.1 hypothetical protein HBH53_222500 [Parastagonospora nodorum]KAH4012303.1 hypothetical protein HBI13_191500 [Parastagonospora nodorum]KAH4061874.1 hypothetical protein HBH50_216590 [Parastagonospora nodorum]